MEAFATTKAQTDTVPMRRWHVLVAIVAALFCALSLAQSVCAAGLQQQARSSAALAALADRYYEAQARSDPVYSATLAGDNRFDERLPITIAPATVRKRFAMYHRIQRQLIAIDRRRVSTTDALTYDLLARELRTRIGFEKFNDHLLPLQQMDAIPTLLANLGSGQAEQPLKTVAQYDAYLKRITRLPAWTDQAIANMREGMRRRIVQPKPVVEATLAQVRSLVSETVVDNPFYAPIRNLPASFPDHDRLRLTVAYHDAVEKRIAPSLRKLAGFVEKEYLPASR